MDKNVLEKQIDSTIGNISIEGINIPKNEKDLILRVFKKYKDRLGTEAIDSLFYGLVTEINYEVENEKQK